MSITFVIDAQFKRIMQRLDKIEAEHKDAVLKLDTKLDRIIEALRSRS